MAWKTFGNDRGDRCDENRQIFVQNGAILAIFRPFEFFDLGFDLGFDFGFDLGFDLGFDQTFTIFFCT